MLLWPVPKYAIDTTTEEIYLRTRSDGRLFNLARLRAKTNVRRVLTRDMLFAAVVTHTQEKLQSFMDCFSQACMDFGLTISLKKTNVLWQDIEEPPVIIMEDYELDAVYLPRLHHHWQPLLGPRDQQEDWEGHFNSCSSHGSSVDKPKLSVETNMAAYNACVTSTLLYRSETWTTYAGQKRRLNTFHLRSIRRILGISWQDKVTNADVLSCAGLPSMYTLLRQCRLRWLRHVRRMEDGHFQKTSSTVSWHWGGEQPPALICDIKMSA